MSLFTSRLFHLSVGCALVGLGARDAEASQASLHQPTEFRGFELPQPEVSHVKLPLIGASITQRKAFDPRTGDVVGGTIDGDGRAVDLGELVRREMQVRANQPKAKLTRRLRSAVEANPAAQHQVVLWLSYDDAVLDQASQERMEALGPDPSSEALEEAEASVAAFVMERMAMLNGMTIEEVQNLGVSVRYASTTAPAIFVDADGSQVEALAALSSVETLYLESDDAKDLDTSSHGTHRTTTTQSLGWNGSGIRVGVLENNGIDPNHPFLNVYDWFDDASPRPDWHVQATAGCIASLLNSRRGGANGVRLYSANARSYSDTEITRAADWIVTRNLDLTNMSYGATRSGELTYQTRYFDYQSRVYQDSYVAAAGNDASWVATPALAWNCVTVGAFDDRNSAFWWGDRMSSFSNDRNPTNGCLKPNLAASGTSVDTLGLGGNWLRNDADGTSFSAPYVSAGLAVAMSRDASARVSPEAAMAAMMASAWHKIVGATRLSNEDGAGGLHQLAAAKMGARNGITYFNVTRSSFSNGGFRTYNLYLRGGDRTRVAIAWSANAGANYTSSVLNADLDLSIYRGVNATSGVAYGHSFSGTNNFEIVEFTPPSTGYYTVRVNDWRFDGTSERVGLAWSQRNRDNGL